MNDFEFIDPIDRIDPKFNYAPFNDFITKVYDKKYEKEKHESYS